MEYSIQTKKYEGPMELLLDLISRNKIDITDISIVEITEQYLEYIDNMEKFDLDLTSDFIDMASRLLQIKSRYILYVKDNTSTEEDPRKELVHKIEEYKKYKELTEIIKDNMNEFDNRYYRAKEELIIEEELDLSALTLELVDKMAKKLFQKLEEVKEVESVLNKNEKLKKIITNKNITVESRMDLLRDNLLKNKILKFSSIISKIDKNEIIANFLAILELIKLKEVIISQNAFCDEILIEKRNTDDEIILEEVIDSDDLKIINKANRRYERKSSL